MYHMAVLSVPGKTLPPAVDIYKPLRPVDPIPVSRKGAQDVASGLTVHLLIIEIRNGMSANQKAVVFLPLVSLKWVFPKKQPSPDCIHLAALSLRLRVFHIIKIGKGVRRHDESSIQQNVTGKRKIFQPFIKIVLLFLRQIQKSLPGHSAVICFQPVFRRIADLLLRNSIFHGGKKHQLMISHETMDEIILLIHLFDRKNSFHGFLTPVPVISEKVQRI